MYNPKFDYKPVPRVVVEGKRFYATPDGNKLPSVLLLLLRLTPPILHPIMHLQAM